MQGGASKARAATRPSPLKVGSSKAAATRKPPMPLPIFQYRQPVIIHTYSPKIIETDATNFMWLVQRLTGSSDTRLRCESCKPAVVPTDMPTSPGSTGASSSSSCFVDRVPPAKKIKLESGTAPCLSHNPNHFPQHQQQLDKQEQQEQEQQQQQSQEQIPFKVDQMLLSPSSSSDSVGIFCGRPSASPKSTLLSYQADQDQLLFPAATPQSSAEQQSAYVVPSEQPQQQPLPWSPLLTPPSHDFLAELQNVFAVSSQELDLTSPPSRFSLPSPATLAYRDFALSFLKDPSSTF